MATDETGAAVGAAPPATYADWIWLLEKSNELTVPRCLLELRRRVEALEAAGGVAGNPGHAPAVPVGVSVEELADCLPANAWAGPEGYSRQAFARHLLDHPRIGPLLRGEGAPAPKRVVLPERPPIKTAGRSLTELAFMAYRDGCCDTWAAARTEVERQQQGGQVDA